MRTFPKLMVTVAVAAGGLVVAAVAIAPAAHAVFTAGDGGGKSEVVQLLANLPERSQVYDDKGNLIDVFHAEVNRDPVTWEDIPRGVAAAVVDTEDSKFWNHHGVNPWATARALFNDTSSGGIRQGGSTITQQLVKNTLLTNERTLTRKLKEAVLAVRLENELTKQQILTDYLNTVYFGNGAYGIKAAAEVYFGVPVRQLTRIQGALLAGLINDPDGEDPFRFPQQSKVRRDFVLDRMAVSGDLTRAEAAAAKDVALPTQKFTPTAPPDGQDSYFLEEVKQRLLNDPTLGDTPQARYNAVFRGGMKIYTTLDPDMQQAAKQAVADNLPDENGTWTSALVAVDTKTSAVRAIVGGPGFNKSQYRIATSGPGRQPGSSFKPIVLATALKEGYNVYGTINGTSPCIFKDGSARPAVINNDEGNGSYMSIVAATAGSVNCAFARMGVTVGLDNVISMAQQLGVTTPLKPFISLSIGAEEVRPIDMAGVFATFANDGVHHKPFLVDHINDRSGNLVFQGGDKGVQVLSPNKAHEELVALRAVVTGGTGGAAGLADRQAAGKTGTAEHNDNAWFDGITPQLTAVVWMGSPIGNVPMYSVGGITASGNYEGYRTVFGGTYPAMIWHDFMTRALAGQPAIDFPAADPNDLGDLYSVPNPPGSSSPDTSTTTTPVDESSTTIEGGTTIPGGGPGTTVKGSGPSTTAPGSTVVPTTPSTPAPTSPPTVPTTTPATAPPTTRSTRGGVSPTGQSGSP
ncbi:MAG: transglycosylase domain-containing protein [Acidimicrobiales bacterium]